MHTTTATAPTRQPRGEATTSVVDLRGLTKTFPGKEGPIRAVDGIDLNISPGEIVAFLGPNGAGKTTALDMMLGLTEPDSGTAAVLGLKPRQAVLAGRISAVLQTGGLLRDLTVVETIRYIASTFADALGVDYVLERAGLTALRNRRVSKCSGGEQQRLRFALALLPDPDLLILDEPTAGMDVSARREFWQTMRADADSGRTVIFATHYLEEANNFAERIVMISGGRIVADGSTTEIRERNSGRTLTADLPEGDVEAWLRQLAAVDGVVSVSREAGRVRVQARNTDALALTLLRDLGGSGLEIASADLESAFVSLTGTAPAEANNGATESDVEEIR